MSSQGEIAQIIAGRFPDSAIVTNSEGQNPRYEVQYHGETLITFDNLGVTFAIPVRGSPRKSWSGFGEGGVEKVAESFLKDLADAGFVTLDTRGLINEKRRVSIGKGTHCPKCSASGSIRQIIYGMPSDEVNLERYIVGGCLQEENAPEIACTLCDWSGTKEVLRFPRRRI